MVRAVERFHDQYLVTGQDWYLAVGATDSGHVISSDGDAPWSSGHVVSASRLMENPTQWVKAMALSRSVTAIIFSMCLKVLAVSSCCLLPFLQAPRPNKPRFLRAPRRGWRRTQACSCGGLSDWHCCPSSCWIVGLIVNYRQQLISSFLPFFFHRSTLINLKKHLSSSYPEPCQMKNISKNQVNPEII